MREIIENKFFNPPDLTSEYDDYSKTPNENNNYTRSDSFCSGPRKPEANSGDATFLFWTLVVFIFILAFGNLILTFVILGVLRLGHGMESIEIMADSNMVKFFGTTDLDRIDKIDGKLEGFSDLPVHVIGDASSVLLRLNSAEQISPSIDIGLGASYVQVNSFQVSHPDTGSQIFSTQYPDFGLPKGVNTLDIKLAKTKRITSPIDSKLLIRSDTFVNLKGTEGTKIDGSEVVWSADQDIFLKSVNRSIILSGNEGIYIDIKYIPLAKETHKSPNHTQYKICVCMPNGRLFRVPAGDNCVLEGVSMEQHPCI